LVASLRYGQRGSWIQPDTAGHQRLLRPHPQALRP
jgi:hypothetical protein